MNKKNKNGELHGYWQIYSFSGNYVNGKRYGKCFEMDFFYTYDIIKKYYHIGHPIFLTNKQKYII